MKRGFKVTLVTVAIALMCSGAFAYAPIIGAIPDVWIGDAEDNVGATTDLNFFRFTDAFNFDKFVSKDANDEDQSTTNVRWSFLADNANLLTINGINTIADATEAIQPELVSKELTSYPNNDATPPGEDGRPGSWATFYDLVDSPIGFGPPWPDPVVGSELDTIITIYASNGVKADSKQIAVRAKVADGVVDQPDGLSTGIEHVYLWDSPATQGFTGYGSLQGQTIADPLGDFVVAQHVTSGGSVGGVGTTSARGYALWSSPADVIAYQDGNVYQIRYTVRTNQADSSKVPNVRLYTEMVGTGILAVSGGMRVGAGPNAPDTAGKVINAYVEAPDMTGSGVTNVKVNFEVIAFAATEEGTVYLDQVDVWKFAAPEKTDGTLEYSYDGSFAGWTSLSNLGAPLGPTTMASTASGLSIQTPATSSSYLCVGIWTRGASGSPVAFEADKLYRCVYTVSSPSSGPNSAGKIRLYNANGDSAWAAQLGLASDQTQVHMPDAAGKDYSVWFETMPTLYGDATDAMSFNFDIADGSDQQYGTVILSKVELYSYDIP